MKNITFGALPADTTVDYNLLRVHRTKLFNHYINHKIDSSNTVLENIIISFNNKYRPERYLFKQNLNSQNIYKSIEDIRSMAYLIVWEATDKYLSGYNIKSNIQYKEKFNFCVFASEQVKFKLKTHLRLLNINRTCGKLPDSDSIRKIYSQIPKFKDKKEFLTKDKYEAIAKENSIKIDEIKLVDKFINTKIESGDEEIENKDDNKDNLKKWDFIGSGENIEEKVDKKIVIERFNKIINDFLKNLPLREKEILNCTKLSEFGSNEEVKLNKIGKKFNISAERVRQIAEKNFEELKKILIKNKKHLEIQ